MQFLPLLGNTECPIHTPENICDRFEWPTPKARATASRGLALVSQRSARYMSHFDGNSLPTPQAQTLYFCFRNGRSCSCSTHFKLQSQNELPNDAKHTALSSHSPLSVGFESVSVSVSIFGVFLLQSSTTLQLSLS